MSFFSVVTITTASSANETENSRKTSEVKRKRENHAEGKETQT